MKLLIENRLKQAEIVCKKSNVKLTAIRKNLLSLIYSQKEPITAYELLHLYRKMNPKAESMTIYRALDFLQTNHFIHRIASQSAYAACDTPEEKHQAHFLLCEKCGQSQEISSTTLIKAVKKLAQEYHFALSDHPIEIVGVCKQCNH